MKKKLGLLAANQKAEDKRLGEEGKGNCSVDEKKNGMAFRDHNFRNFRYGPSVNEE